MPSGGVAWLLSQERGGKGMWACWSGAVAGQCLLADEHLPEVDPQQGWDKTLRNEKRLLAECVCAVCVSVSCVCKCVRLLCVM